MTDSRGETVYFTECLIVFTSNIGMNPGIADEDHAEQDLSYVELERKVRQALRENWRPEFINRIGQNVIVFDYIREKEAEAILQKQLDKICALIESQKNIQNNLDTGQSVLSEIKSILYEESSIWRTRNRKCGGILFSDTAGT